MKQYKLARAVKQYNLARAGNYTRAGAVNYQLYLLSVLLVVVLVGVELLHVVLRLHVAVVEESERLVFVVCNLPVLVLAPPFQRAGK